MHLPNGEEFANSRNPRKVPEQKPLAPDPAPLIMISLPPGKTLAPTSLS